MTQLQVKQLPKIWEQFPMIRPVIFMIKHKFRKKGNYFSCVLTSSNEKARESYSPNPSINEHRFERLEASALTPRFSMSLFLKETSRGNCRHPKTCERSSIVGITPAETISR